jgi:2-succinyl-6-hydroxy-2,4-cyclohexadiene-1-carboxylate synthase
VGADFVFVHGFTQSPASWAPVRDLLESPTHAPAVPGAADFRETALGLDVGRGSYVGYSMGGRLCLQLALDRPDVVERLVLVSASPGISSEVQREARREADERLARDIERGGVDAFLEHWLAQPLFRSLPRERANVEERRAANTVATLTHQLRVLGQGAQPSNWDRLGELRMPVLMIAGELDSKYVELAHRMAGAVPQASVEVLAGAGHACHLEQPETVAHLLTSW